MDNNKQLRLAGYLQAKLHNCFLPGFYFDVEDVYDIIEEFNEQEEAVPEAKYYLDRRTNTIKKNLDIKWMAPELYVEVRVDESRKGMYLYTYVDLEERRLDWYFTIHQLTQSNVSFEVQEAEYLKANGFNRMAPSERVLFMCQGDFDMYLEKEVV